MTDAGIVRKPLSTRIDSRVLDRLDRWIASNRLNPTKRTAIELALTEFLDAQEERELRDAVA